MTERDQNQLYHTLAYIYDEVMEEVNYEAWADFIDEVIHTHHAHPYKMLELACGTGTMSISLEELGDYEIVATDKSPVMIEMARQKKRESWSKIRFEVQDFLNIQLDEQFDVVFCVFDSINYLHEPDQIHQLFREVQNVLKPDGIFIFDFTTPRNSVKAIDFLNNEEGHAPNHYRFFRRSEYDARKQIHYNIFDIEKMDVDDKKVVNRHQEVHEQRIYTLREMMNIIDASDYKILAKYDGFDLVEANDKSLRITMVLQCPTIQ